MMNVVCARSRIFFIYESPGTGAAAGRRLGRPVGTICGMTADPTMSVEMRCRDGFPAILRLTGVCRERSVRKITSCFIRLRLPLLGQHLHPATEWVISLHGPLN